MYPCIKQTLQEESGKPGSQREQKKAAEVAGSAPDPEEEEDWDADVMPFCALHHLD